MRGLDTFAAAWAASKKDDSAAHAISLNMPEIQHIWGQIAAVGMLIIAAGIIFGVQKLKLNDVLTWVAFIAIAGLIAFGGVVLMKAAGGLSTLIS